MTALYVNSAEGSHENAFDAFSDYCVKAHLADGASATETSGKSFYFLEGLWAMSPFTPVGLPPGAGRAFVMKKRSDAKEGDVVFATPGDDDTSCLMMPMMPMVPKLMELWAEVDHGPGLPL